MLRYVEARIFFDILIYLPIPLENTYCKQVHQVPNNINQYLKPYHPLYIGSHYLNQFPESDKKANTVTSMTLTEKL